jgi:hypothetical protein
MNTVKVLRITTAILTVALVVSLGIGWKIRRDMRQEILVLSDANGILRQTLGELTTAITAKEKQIDSLSQSPCGRSEPSGRTGGRSFLHPAPRPPAPARLERVNHVIE